MPTRQRGACSILEAPYTPCSAHLHLVGLAILTHAPQTRRDDRPVLCRPSNRTGVRVPSRCVMTMLCHGFPGWTDHDRSIAFDGRQTAHAQRALLRSVAIVAGFSLGVFVAGTLAFSVIAVAAEIVSYAIVQDTARFGVRGKTIRLFGIYMPWTERNCRATSARRCAATVRCAPR